MKSHNASKFNLDNCQAALLSSQAQAHVTVAQQLQQIEGQNREAIEALVRSAHYLACYHIAHTKMIWLV